MSGFDSAERERARLEDEAVRRRQTVTRTALVRQKVIPDVWRREAVGQVVSQCCGADMGIVRRTDPERTGPLVWRRPNGWRQDPASGWWKQQRGWVKQAQAVLGTLPPQVPKRLGDQENQALPVVLCCPTHGHPHLLPVDVEAPASIGQMWRERGTTRGIRSTPMS